MKRLLIVALCLAGCAAPQPVNELQIAWSGDGNPAVLPCGAVKADCKVGIEIVDRTTGDVIQLPIDSTVYLAPHALDSYEVRVTGFDHDGRPLASAFVEVK